MTKGKCGHDPLLKSLCDMWNITVDFSLHHRKDVEKIIKDIKKSVKDSRKEEMMSDVVNLLEVIGENLKSLDETYFEYHRQLKTVADSIGYTPPSL
jgi:transcriptional regulator NrdR family protein